MRNHLPKVHAPQSVTYELHSLGWKAFQELCATIMRELMGQHVQQFFDSRDGGRDGAFNGEWRPVKGARYRGQFTVQCKFSAKRDKQLSLKDLTDEKSKAERLAASGLATHYILMTSMNVTGVADEQICKSFTGLKGLRTCTVYGYEWICNVIRETPRLRMLVPRIYGLGDLSELLDERAKAQAREILSSMGDDLRKFVITESHQHSVRALSEHGFVLLLGEPAAGKSTIAASLAVAAIDRWQLSTFKIRNATEFLQHSNPHDQAQFFWVDDAFGATQFEHTAADEWNRAFPHLSAAIRRGARVLFTSRDYIFRAAREYLKESAFPLIKESQVVINVANLTSDERRQILYNHIRLGRQPKAFRSEIKCHLNEIAGNSDFKPEIARRLGDPIFTSGLTLTSDDLTDFVERPMDHLREVLQTLDSGSKAAIAMIFMRGGSLASPIRLTPEECRAAALIGGNTASVAKALNSLKESLVLLEIRDGRRFWKLKHPTIRDAFAANIAEDAELLDIYLAGATGERLLSEVSCGVSGIEGVAVVVPSDRYDRVLALLRSADTNDRATRGQLHHFLRYRSDERFVREFVANNPAFIESLKVGSYLSVISDVDALARLNQLGLLPTQKRRQVIRDIERLAIETPDAGFLERKCRPLFRKGEVEKILGTVREELLPNLDWIVDNWRSDFDFGRDDDPESHFSPLTETLGSFRDAFEQDQEAVGEIDTALALIESAIDELVEEMPPERDYDDDFGGSRVRSSMERSVFDDVDQ